MEPDRCVRLHKFSGLRCRRQAYPCTVTWEGWIGSKKADIEKNDKFVTIKADIKKIYEGCLGEGKSIHNSQNVILNTVRLSKDDVKYKLI